MKNLFKLALVFVLQISCILFSQNRIDLPSRGETIELEGNSRNIPYEFNNVNENDNSPYSFLYSSEKGEALNISLSKNDDKFEMALLNDTDATFDFYNNGEIIGSFPVNNLPRTDPVVHGGPGVVIAVIAIVVVMCCVKVKYKKTVKTATSTITTWEVSWDCDCLSIELRNANKPKVRINDRELEFDKILINTRKDIDESKLNLKLAH